MPIALHHVRNWFDSSGARTTSVGLSVLAVAGPVREQPRPGARRKALVTADASAPGGAAPFAATRERLMWLVRRIWSAR